LTTQFYIDVDAGIFRSTAPGDSAISPTNPADVRFDAFGPRYGGAILSGQVPWSSFTGPTSYNTGNSQVVSSYYYSYQINFASAFSYIPFTYASYQNSSGVWLASFSSGSVTYYTYNGIEYPQGTSVLAGYLATTTYMLLYLQVVNFVNPVGWSVPNAYSYRVYGL
jgi:hypothetical protein